MLQKLIQQLPDVWKHFGRQRTSPLHFNQFFCERASVPPCLDAQLNPQSVFLSDYFDGAEVARYYLVLVATVSIVSGQYSSVNFDAFSEAFGSLQPGSVHVSWVQNLIVFCLLCQKTDFVEGLLQGLSQDQQQQFLQQTQGTEINIASGVQVLKRLDQVVFLNKTYTFALVQPVMPARLPEYLGLSSCNPLA